VISSIRCGAALAIVLALALAAALPPAVASAAAGGTTACPSSTERVQLTTSTTLRASCSYGGVDITRSNVTLDCNGAAIVGDRASAQVGIVVRAPADVTLAHVTVRNCRVQGFLNSLRVTRDGFRDLPVGGEYTHTTSDIVVEGSRFSGSRGVGVYVDGYVSDVSIRNNQVRGAGSSGIYLEAGSRHNTVAGNTIADNGYLENGPSGQPFSFGGANLWFWGVGREGLSVDGSYDNTIVGNRFSGNSAGGLFLYENCGEYPSSGHYFERRTSASHNLIQGNTFTGGRNGVWVGSRMGENTLPMACASPAYVNEGYVRVVLDHADHNVVDRNRFLDVTYGVRVEDDATTVSNNTFDAQTPDHHAVVVGTPYRTSRLGQPVRGTVLVGNVSRIAANPNPYRWVDGETQTTVQANSAVGLPVGICQGPELPRQAFIFVIALAFANPDGTPPPTPDLAVPTLGALPACPNTEAPPPVSRR